MVWNGENVFVELPNWFSNHLFKVRQTHGAAQAPDSAFQPEPDGQVTVCVADLADGHVVEDAESEEARLAAELLLKALPGDLVFALQKWRAAKKPDPGSKILQRAEKGFVYLSQMYPPLSLRCSFCSTCCTSSWEPATLCAEFCSWLEARQNPPPMWVPKGTMMVRYHWSLLVPPADYCTVKKRFKKNEKNKKIKQTVP